jgi:putative MATE family efflux protein
VNFAKLKYYSRINYLLKDVKKAISGSDQDFTKGSLKKAIFLLSIPMVLEMIMESIFAVVDIKFVSELGADAVATVGITESLITIIYAISVGLSMATTALVSRRIGEKKNRDASIAAFQAILLGILFSSIIAIPGVIFSKQILELMGASTEIVENMSGYATIMLGGNGIIMLLFIINAIFRSSGDAAISMRVLWLANILNLILDPLLIFGIGPFPELGVKGAAIATNIGRGTAVIFQFYLLFSGKHRIKLDLSILKIDFKVIRKLIKISYGGIFQYLIATSSWIGLVRIISIFGSEIVAGYTIAIRIIIFSLLPSWGISNAAATLVGQNLGANKPDRAEKSVWITGKINMIIMGIMGIIFVIFPDFFVKLFIDDPVVVSSGSSCLRIVSFGFIAYGLGMVLANAFNGAGDTITPTKINFISFWIIEIPIAYILSLPFGMREEGVFLSIIIAEIVMTILAAYLFKQGKWKLKIV